MRDFEQINYCGKLLSREEVQQLFESSKKDKNKMITEDIYHYMGFDCGGMLTELMDDDTLGYRYWYCKRMTSDPDRFDFLVYWDMGNSWASTETVVENKTLDEFIQYVKENRNLFSQEPDSLEIMLKNCEPEKEETVESPEVRIISDFYMKKEKEIWGNDPNSEFNQKIIAVNNMYDWLYEKGILKKESFVFKDYENASFFAVDVKDLEKYRKEMEASNVPSAALAVSHIFDIDCNPCRYSGAFQLAYPMVTYRDNGGCVGHSWECDIIQDLTNEAANNVRLIKDERGVKAAVEEMYKMLTWNPELSEDEQ